jgi:hypothetical protein
LRENIVYSVELQRRKEGFAEVIAEVLTQAQSKVRKTWNSLQANPSGSQRTPIVSSFVGI